MLFTLLKVTLDFQSLHLVGLTDRWSTFYESKNESFDRHHLLSSAIDKKERETWKMYYESTQ